MQSRQERNFPFVMDIISAGTAMRHHVNDRSAPARLQRNCGPVSIFDRIDMAIEPFHPQIVDLKEQSSASDSGCTIV
jgi:hypothetical protein